MSQPCVARAASTAASSASITTFFFFFAPAAVDAASRSNAAPTSAARMLRVAIPSGSIPSFLNADLTDAKFDGANFGSKYGYVYNSDGSDRNWQPSA